MPTFISPGSLQPPPAVGGSQPALPFDLILPAAFASLQTDASQQGNVFTAQTAGLAGNALGVAFVDNTGSLNVALSVSVVSETITVQLGTDGSGVLVSTAAQVGVAINADGPAHALIQASLPPGFSGTGIIPPDFSGLNLLHGGYDGAAFTVEQNGNNLTVSLGLLEINSGNAGSLFVRAPGGLTADAKDSAEFDDPNGFTMVGIDNFAYLYIGNATAPADDAFDNTRRLRLWYDNTHGAAKLMIKAIDSNGAIVTGSVNLT